MAKVAVVTGASSGIGQAVARILGEKGYRVYGVSRRGFEDGGNLVSVRGDVTDRERMDEIFAEIISAEGHIDLLVNNAGFGISGAVEFTAEAQARRQMDVNFMGTVNCCAAVAGYLRASRGRIINISSAAAVFPIPFQSFYSASKSAVNTFSMALANELKPLSVSVTAVMLGDVKTGFTEARHKDNTGSSIYTSLEASVAVMERDEMKGADPEWIAGRIVDIAGYKRVKLLYTIGIQYKLLYLLYKLLHIGTVNRVIAMLYMPKQK